MTVVAQVSHAALRTLVCLPNLNGNILFYGKKEPNSTCTCIHYSVQIIQWARSLM